MDNDWYTYLTEDFKLDRAVYRAKHRAVVDCPSCGSTDFVRVNHLKSKVERLGFYECSKCRKKKGAAKARALYKEKHGAVNAFHLNKKSKFK